MASEMEKKGFSKADEVRTFPKGKVELITIGGATIGRATLEPGWRWSKSVQPIANTKSCEAPHFQYHVAGTLKVVMDDGTELVPCRIDLETDQQYRGNETNHEGWKVHQGSLAASDEQFGAYARHT